MRIDKIGRTREFKRIREELELLVAERFTGDKNSYYDVTDREKGLSMLSTNRLQKQPKLNKAVIVMSPIICYNIIRTSACYFILEEQNEYFAE